MVPDHRRPTLAAGLLAALIAALLWAPAPAPAAGAAPATGGAPSGAHPGSAGRTATFSGSRTVTYCDDGGTAERMTLFPPARRDGPVPVVVQVHGGGWERGGRLVSLAQSTTARLLVAHGFMVASVGYRLAPKHPWPDQIVDVLCAVRYLHADAGRLGIDPDRIAAWGTSAGGQLVSLLATAPSTRPWRSDQYADDSDRIAAVVDEFGPADLTARRWPRYTSALIRRVFGHPPGPAAALAGASPVRYVAPGDPDFLIVQGTDDRVVPASQSEELAGRLARAHVEARLVLVRGGGHGLGSLDERPSPAALSHLIVSYLVGALGPERAPSGSSGGRM